MRYRTVFAVGVASIAALTVFVALAPAQTPAPLAFTTHQLKPNIYWVEGGGGNSGVIVGDKGVIVVDTKTTLDSGKELLAQIAKITPKPITHVILTHSDGDHANGLFAFPTGITIIAHENNKKEQQESLAMGGPGSPPADHLPTQLVTKNKESLTLEGIKFETFHWEPAHTSGDLVVYLPGEKIMFTGDIIATDVPDPLVHLQKSGTTHGWFATVKGMLGIGFEQAVPGHGDVQSRADIEKRMMVAETKYAKIKELVGQGMMLDKIEAAVGDPPTVAGRGRRGPGTYTEVVYYELMKKGT
jgi:glyoxylase-like metal-dependent hydrolase (beta-lactamase superfamily II)